MSPPSEAAALALEAVLTETTQVSNVRLLDHDYDGIREYDNPLPGWWSMMFCASIVFAVCYGFYYHVVDWGRFPAEDYRAALAEYDEGKGDRERASVANATEESLGHQAADPQVVTRGAAIFASKCVSCHQPDGSGLIGPNLTDQFQLHGETRMDIFGTVRRGVPGTAMLAWSELMAPTDITNVVAFVLTLRGKNLPGKLREGLRVEAFKPVL
ncbi:MAG: cbb3-type cytochrome c oxidase N-terminal domain-containing protein [Kofleriaceae bacterium]